MKRVFESEGNLVNAATIPSLGPVTPTMRLKRCTYSQPHELCCYSTDTHRKPIFDSRTQLKYYCAAKTPLDLKHGFPHKFIEPKQRLPNGRPTEYLDDLLECLKHSKQSYKPHFCTWRGIATLIMCTPYNRYDEPWQLRASRCGNTVYLIKTPETKLQSNTKKMKSHSDDAMKQFMYMGYRFETISTSDKPQAIAEEDSEYMERLEADVDANTQFCSVFRTKIGDFETVMGAEVDCITHDVSEGERVQNAYCELKTTRIFTHQKQQENFERQKMMQIWAQAFLCGVPRVIIGFRRDDGMLDHVKEYETVEFPRIARKHAGCWDPNYCLSFLQQVLRFIWDTVRLSGPDIVYTISYSPQSKLIEVQQVSHSLQFLPDGT